MTEREKQRLSNKGRREPVETGPLKCPSPGCHNPEDGNCPTGQCLDCVTKALDKVTEETREPVKPEDLNWEEVKEAAEVLIKLADDAINWKPPEHRGLRLNDAVDEVNRIAEALCLPKG